MLSGFSKGPYPSVVFLCGLNYMLIPRNLSLPSPSVPAATPPIVLLPACYDQCLCPTNPGPTSLWILQRYCFPLKITQLHSLLWTGFSLGRICTQLTGLSQHMYTILPKVFTHPSKLFKSGDPISSMATGV